MARKVRVCYPGVVYHVMARGNERVLIYCSAEDSDIWNYALVNQAAIITKDQDFAERLASHRQHLQPLFAGVVVAALA